MNRSSLRALTGLRLGTLLPATLLLTPLLLAASTRARAQAPREEGVLLHPTPGELDGAGYPDAFGNDVDISDDGAIVVVGAPNDDTTAGINAGTAYVFVRTGTTWTRETELIPEGIAPAANQQFGARVAISADGTRIVVGRPGANAIPGGDPEGGVDVYLRTATGWEHEALLGGLEQREAFGAALALSDDAATLVVGAPGPSHQGDARIFVRTGATWTLALDIVPPQLGFFGAEVAVSGDGSRVAIALPSGNVGGGIGSGGAIIYRRMAATWIEEATIAASFAGTSDLCFTSLAFDAAGTRLLGGCVNDVSGGLPARGSVAAFVRSGTTWTEEAVLAPAGGMRDAYFGNSVSLTADGSRAVIGMYGDYTFGVLSNGSVRVFERVGATWSESGMTPFVVGSHALGLSVAFVPDGTRFVAGAPSDGDPGDTYYTSARVFTFGPEVMADAGTELDAGGELDAGMVDAAIAEDAGTDASVSPDAPAGERDASSLPDVGSEDGGAMRADTGSTVVMTGGCGCNVPVSRGGPRGTALLALGLAVFMLRRHARRAHASTRA